MKFINFCYAVFRRITANGLGIGEEGELEFRQPSLITYLQ